MLSNFVNILAQVLIFAIVARAILTWFPNTGNNPFVAIVYQVTEPILAPLRRIIPRIGMIDISPVVAILLLQLVILVIGQA
ncbi:MAG: YggT family protein [Chloroflexi bacterium]|nr:YggT family protein [Chloroflexota bacterium]